jgi:hypothetical protein
LGIFVGTSTKEESDKRMVPSGRGKHQSRMSFIVLGILVGTSVQKEVNTRIASF